MKLIRGSIAAKVLAFILAVFFITGIISFGLCIDYCHDSGTYGYEVRSFEESGICRDFILKKIYNLTDYIYWNDIEGVKLDNFLYNDASFSFIIRSDTGEALINTIGSESVLAVKEYTGYEVDQNGNATNKYSIDGYINLPVKAGTSAYPYYLMYKYRVAFFAAELICIVCGAALFVFLMYSAGVDKDGSVKLSRFNRIPYDIILLAALLVFAMVSDWFYYPANSIIIKVIMTETAFSVIAVLILTISFSAGARFKVKGWWKNALLYKITAGLFNFLRWVLMSIPDTWKLVLIYCAFVLTNLLLFILMIDIMEVFAVIALVVFDVVGLVLIIWFGDQLKMLKRAGEEFSSGNYNYKIDTSRFWPSLKRHGDELNGAAAGMEKALEAKIRSEHFKAELITNVSHDLKTPLTSIVSYVDLLKKEEIENEKAKEYIEVIDRQSAKLKKLTEDIVEASKASSGAIPVNKENLNISELIMQSVGEFSEKLEAAGITPVVNSPEEELFVCSDGHLIWRVLSNLTQNIVKYAQPETRAYFDIVKIGQNVRISVKNVSKDPLNISADALMERFVRGDSSRNSEGNGLGLSIAKSLTELCGGRFNLILDGDLYKAVLTFPLVENTNAPC